MRTKEQLIKELPIEEILDELCSANNKYVVGIEASPEYREIFSRLEQGEDLKCCANCCHSTDGFECYAEKPMSMLSDYCDKWTTDGMTRSQRLIA
jgi:hypothetical protein